MHPLPCSGLPADLFPLLSTLQLTPWISVDLGMSLFPLPSILQLTPWISVDLGMRMEVQKVVLIPQAASFGPPATTGAQTFTVRPADGACAACMGTRPPQHQPAKRAALHCLQKSPLVHEARPGCLGHPFPLLTKDTHTHTTQLQTFPPPLQVRVSDVKPTVSVPKPDTGIDRRWGLGGLALLSCCCRRCRPEGARLAVQHKAAGNGALMSCRTLWS